MSLASVELISAELTVPFIMQLKIAQLVFLVKKPLDFLKQSIHSTVLS